MKKTAFKQGLNGFNLLLVATFLVLALYSAIGQQILPYIGQYKADTERYLSDQLNSPVSIAVLSGDMKMLTPSIQVEGITLHGNDPSLPPILKIASVEAILDSRLSLINLAPVFKSIRLSGVSLSLGEDIAYSNEDSSGSNNAQVIQSFIEGLLLQQHIEFTDVSIETNLNNQKQNLAFDQLVMTGDSYNRLMAGSLSYGHENEIKTSVRIYSQGNPYDLSDFYARGVMDIPNLDVAYWLKKFTDISPISEMHASGILGFEFKNGLLNYAKLNVVSPLLTLSDREPIKQLSTEIWLKQKGPDSWGLWLEDGALLINEKQWQLNNLGVELTKTFDGTRWHGFLEKMDLTYWQNFLAELNVLPKAASELLNQLKPTGNIGNINIIYQDNEGQKPEATLAAELIGVSIQASNGIPQLVNVSGVLATSQDRGRLQFSSKNMELFFPAIYESPFRIKSGRGQVDWHLAKEQISLVGNGLDLNLEGLESVKGGFQLWLPKTDEVEPALALNLSLTKASVEVQKILVPKAVNSGLKEWLNSSLQNGDVENGNFFLYSSLAGEESKTQMEMYFNFQDVDLEYLEGWPNIQKSNGKLFIENEQVFGSINSANTLGGELTNVQVIFQQDKNSDGFLWIEGDSEGKGSELLSYLQVTDLKDLVDDVMNGWTLEGVHQTRLGLKIPLDTPIEDTRVDVSSALTNSDFYISDADLTISSLTGGINYRTSDGLSSTPLNANLWGQSLKAKIASEVIASDLKTDITFSGNVDSKHLKSWLKLGLLNGLTGNSMVKGHFLIDTQKGGFTGLRIESDLKGMALELPEPLHKQPLDSVFFNTSLEINEGLTLKLAYDEKVNLALRMEKGNLIAGQVFLGATEAYVPSTQGMIIQGHVPKINVDEWLAAWEGIGDLNKKYGSDESESDNIINKIVLSSDELTFKELRFEHIKSEIRQQDGSWLLDIDAPIAKGQLVYSVNEPTLINLEYLHWPMLNDTEDKEESDPLADVVPSEFPSLNLYIKEIFVGPTNYGQWKMNLRPTSMGASLTGIEGEIKKLNVKGEIHWSKNNNAQQAEETGVNLILSSKDIGGIQRAWHKKPAVEAEFGEAKMNVTWASSPTDFQFESLNGIVDISFKDGRFIETGDTAALSAFGILNFGAIGRRLRLDFSDVYQSGLHFDSVKGKTKMSNGLISIVDTLDFQGPSANFSASGTVNMLNKELDQELSVTFPIFSTLPLVAILAGFAPPIAASIFVGEKLVGDEIERFSSATYKLTGTWDEPKLNIMKRFDNEIEGKKEKTFWHRMKDVFGMGSDE
jgi:uncharacterized protein (TIGR02099 family)